MKFHFKKQQAFPGMDVKLRELCQYHRFFCSPSESQTPWNEKQNRVYHCPTPHKLVQDRRVPNVGSPLPHRPGDTRNRIENGDCSFSEIAMCRHSRVGISPGKPPSVSVPRQLSAPMTKRGFRMSHHFCSPTISR